MNPSLINLQLYSIYNYPSGIAEATLSFLSLSFPELMKNDKY